MNCKPGDLARIVRPSGGYECNEGALVRVNFAEGGGWWDCTSLSRLRAVEAVRGGRTVFAAPGSTISAHDDYLRPIRDPGDDAVDETLQRLPAPRETEPA